MHWIKTDKKTRKEDKRMQWMKTDKITRIEDKGMQGIKTNNKITRNEDSKLKKKCKKT